MIINARVRKPPPRLSPSPVKPIFKKKSVPEKKKKEVKRKAQVPESRDGTKPKATFDLAHVQQTRVWMRKTFSEAPQTSRNHFYADKSWCAFVDGNKLSRRPNKDTLAQYLIHEVMRGRKGTGISTYLGGIGAVYIENGALSDLTWKEMIYGREIVALKKAIDRREKLLGIKTVKAAAITIEQVEQLCKNAVSYDEVVLAAVSVTAFFNLHRGGELVSPDAGEESLKQPYAQDVRVSESGIGYTITSTKSRVYTEHRLFLDANEVPSWAIKTWTNFWRMRMEAGFEGYPDIFILSDGKIAESKDLNHFLSKAGKYTTHSLRAGGATYLMIIGKSLLQVMTKGRWATISSVLGYIRNEAPPGLGDLLREVATIAGNLREEVLAEFEVLGLE